MTDARKARDLDLLDAVDNFERLDFEGTVWRVVRESRDVLQASPVGARWDPGHFDVLYTSLAPNGAIEEVYFHLSRQPVFPSAVAFKLHKIRIRVRKTLQLPDIELLKNLGVNTDNYTNMDYTRTQAIADVAYFLGFDSLIVPSARWRGLNLVIFTDQVEPKDIEVEFSELVDWTTWRELR